VEAGGDGLFFREKKRGEKRNHFKILKPSPREPRDGTDADAFY